MSSKHPVCAIIGVGPGNGASLAQRFSDEGYQVALVARTTTYGEQLAATLPSARVYACDAGQAEAMAQTIGGIERDLGPVDTLIYNAGSGVWGNLDEVSASDLEACWQVNTLGAFVASKAVAGGMRARGGGNIIIIGATASRRGAAGTIAFAQAKGAQRLLAQSLAKHLWPDNIHVALIIIDGIVDLPRTRARLPDQPEHFFVQPDAVAASAWMLVQQQPSAWSFEIEARPFAEKW